MQQKIKIKQIIDEKQLSPLFQPIIDLTVPNITGYEALIRGPEHTKLHSPNALFNEAKHNDLIVPLEYVCIEIACREFIKKNIQGKLFLNISPMSLVETHAEKHIVEIIRDEFKLDQEQVVIELSEQYPLEDYSLISDSIRFIRNSGYELAIDDLGAGYSSLRVWSEFRPEYVKIDRHFIAGINNDPIKYDFVRSIQEISRSLGCKVIAEGIESEAELKSVRSLGITHAQGFFLGRPNKQPYTSIPSELYNSVNPLKQVAYHRYKETILDLIEHCKPLSVNEPLGKAAEIIQGSKTLNCIPIIEAGVPVGIITRQNLFEIFIGRYGRELHSKKPVCNYMYTNMLIVEKDNTLADVSRMFTSRNQLDMNIDIIITENNKYIGVAKTRKLLEKITEQQIRSARHSNPLTMLPGNVPIYEWIDDLLKRKQNFNLAYFDLNNFKPYNDVYGYTRGDEIIILLSDIIKQNINHEMDRVGHIGGDDFVAIFQSDDWKERCELMLKLFSDEVKYFYKEIDIKNQGIYSFDRRGQSCFFPILSVAIGVVSPDWQTCQSHHDVAALATDAKHEAKKKGGNAIFVSRRRSSQTQLISEASSNYGT